MSWDLVLGFFPEEVQRLILDATISDLMINGTTGIFADRNGVVEPIPIASVLTTENVAGGHSADCTEAWPESIRSEPHSEHSAPGRIACLLS